MAFKIARSANFWLTVTLETIDENGRPVKETLDLQMRRLNAQELQSEFERLKDSDELMGDALLRHTTGWRGVEDEDGKEVPFNQATAKAFYLLSGVAIQVFEQYLKALAGARRKN